MLIIKGFILCFNKNVIVFVCIFDTIYNKRIQLLLFFKSGLICFVMKSSLIIILYLFFAAYNSGN
jgi:hypothetical protein